MTPAESVFILVFETVFGIFAVSILAVMVCWAFLKIIALSVEALADVWFDVKLAWENAFGKKEVKEK